ncbi:hypothetical protein B0H16DRAFT_1448543 [Mycena metata]|uniref:Uncharacterized protein n=1 Tax=Mycena metata TaxID=1033252 RepID=A0AAD7K675_9AGAR|nr:hypothetical protein B0H16DRAFT_1448543 [Mycena metata]
MLFLAGRSVILSRRLEANLRFQFDAALALGLTQRNNYAVTGDAASSAPMMHLFFPPAEHIWTPSYTHRQPLRYPVPYGDLFEETCWTRQRKRLSLVSLKLDTIQVTVAHTGFLDDTERPFQIVFCLRISTLIPSSALRSASGDFIPVFVGSHKTPPNTPSQLLPIYVSSSSSASRLAPNPSIQAPTASSKTQYDPPSQLVGTAASGASAASW